MSNANPNALVDATVIPPSEDQWRANAAKQQREMGATYDQVFSQAAYGEGVRRMQQKRKDLEAFMKRVHPSPWTVFNLMPFPLNVNGVLHSQLIEKNGNQVPACPVGQPCTRKVIPDVLYSIKDEGAGMDNLDNYSPQPCDPSALAYEYINEFKTKMGCGGVYVHEGDVKEDDPAVKPNLEEARKNRNQWLLRKVQEAEVEWGDASGQGRKNITELHRKAAEVLLHEKILKQQPAWLLVANDAGKSPDPCPGCGEVSDAKASICKHCRHVFHPLKAYEAGLIEFGHVAMDRLSRDDLRKALALKAEREKVKREAESTVEDSEHLEVEASSKNTGSLATGQVRVNGKGAGAGPSSCEERE